MTWTMQDDGWIKDEQSRILIWVPYDLRSSILPAKAVSTNYHKYRIRLSFEGAHIGRSWSNCYHPESIHSGTDLALWKWGKAYVVGWYYSLVEVFGM